MPVTMNLVKNSASSNLAPDNAIEIVSPMDTPRSSIISVLTAHSFLLWGRFPDFV